MDFQPNTEVIDQLADLPELQEHLQRVTEVGVRYAKTQCPVRTGRARDSIRNEADPSGSWWILGGGVNNVDYFDEIEFGTRYEEAHHPLLKSIDAMREGR